MQNITSQITESLKQLQDQQKTVKMSYTNDSKTEYQQQLSNPVVSLILHVHNHTLSLVKYARSSRSINRD